MRENPAGTGSPLTSPAARPLVSRPATASSRSPAVSAMVLPLGVLTPVGQLRGGHAHQARRPKAGFGVSSPTRRADAAATGSNTTSTPSRRCCHRKAPTCRRRPAGCPTSPSQADRRRWCWWTGSTTPAGWAARRGGTAADAASNVDVGGWAGLNGVSIASMMAFTDSSGAGPVAALVALQGHRQIAAALRHLLVVDGSTRSGPSMNPNWNAEIRSDAEPCSSPAPPL